MSRPNHNFFRLARFAASYPSDQEVPGRRFPREAGELDLAQRLMESMRHGADLREFKVERLRSAIGSDAYENDLKLSVAVDRLLEKLDVAFD